MIWRFFCLTVFLLLAASSAMAQVDPWEFEVYPAQTVGKGMIEVESLNGFVPKGHSQGDDGTSSGDYPSNLMYRTAIELTYGLSDQVETAAYLDLARPNGAGAFQYAGSKFRLRGSLFEQGEMPVDLGWYAELEWHRTPEFDDNQLEMEFRAIVQKDVGPLSVIINPTFEKAIFVGPNKNKGFEFGYAAGLYYRYLPWVSPGLEFYGGVGLIDDNDPLSQQQHYVFPVLYGKLPGGIEYSLGPGIGLTSGSDSVVTKLNLELEHFVGSLW
ncbi:MAG TPA: hypothetical protein VMU16_11860 [Candidatus Binataceae bacterium]|nr:hypothetical protein [Candidatus Binataceae bacterium]